MCHKCLAYSDKDVKTLVEGTGPARCRRKLRNADSGLLIGVPLLLPVPPHCPNVYTGDRRRQGQIPFSQQLRLWAPDTRHDVSDIRHTRCSCRLFLTYNHIPPTFECHDPGSSCTYSIKDQMLHLPRADGRTRKNDVREICIRRNPFALYSRTDLTKDMWTKCLARSGSCEFSDNRVPTDETHMDGPETLLKIPPTPRGYVHRPIRVKSDYCDRGGGFVSDARRRDKHFATLSEPKLSLMFCPRKTEYRPDSRYEEAELTNRRGPTSIGHSPIEQY
ncbi:hypothetical protein J6590_034847 [Homalodisca vitripennis]|nr:hypothetical protein J6590_034847 [Homalodisca vitripennis]